MTALPAPNLTATHGEPVVLERVHVEVSIDDLLADISLTHHYRNPGTENIEAVYTFPLPFDAVLLGFEAEVGEARLQGTVVEKAESEQRYEEAITGGDTALLLERDGELCTASVGNLLAGESAVIRFRYGLPLRWSGDRVRFAMPTTIAPRYGDPADRGFGAQAQPIHSFDAERDFTLELAVRGVLREARFSSPSHNVRVATEADITRIELDGPAAMDRDFVVEARSALEDASGAVCTPDIDGWVAMASFRPRVPAATEQRRRVVKIVVDCSGSMGGDSIRQARAALERILDGLRPADGFEIVAFGSEHVALFGGVEPVTETSLAKARRFVRELDADLGGTELGEALDAAYAARSERVESELQDVFLVTDGQVWNEEAIIDRARRSGHRVFAVGVGSASAEGLLRLVSARTGGAVEFVSPREDMAERVHRHFQRMYAPVAEGAEVRWPVPATRGLPNSIDTVHDGDTVHAFAWFAERPEGHATLEVTLADGRVLSHEAEVRAMESDAGVTEDAPPATLARMAAAARVDATEDRRVATDMALRYHLLTEWTNYLVVHERTEEEKAEDLPRIVRVPQVVAAGWHGAGSVEREARVSEVAFMREARPSLPWRTWMRPRQG